MEPLSGQSRNAQPVSKISTSTTYYTIHYERFQLKARSKDKVSWCELDEDQAELTISFRASPRSLKPIYTGGPAILTQDGQWLISTLGEEVQVTEVETGLPVARIRGVSIFVYRS